MGLKNVIKRWLDIVPENSVSAEEANALDFDERPPAMQFHVPHEADVADALAIASVVSPSPSPAPPRHKRHRYGDGRPSDTKIACIVDPCDTTSLLESLKR